MDTVLARFFPKALFANASLRKACDPGVRGYGERKCPLIEPPGLIPWPGERAFAAKSGHAEFFIQIKGHVGRETSFESPSFRFDPDCAYAPISDTIKTAIRIPRRIMTSKLPIHATISADRASVSFVAFSREQPIRCDITRKALEQCFWAPVGASDERLLKALSDGYERISARVHRKFLAHPASSIHLDVVDFAS
jgi:hypothetical protein